MAKEGLLALTCAAALLLTAAALPLMAGPADESVTATLAVQTAMQQARDFLLRSDNASAVYVLENQLARINGNAAYLALLKDAYRAHVKDLRLAGKEADAQRYLQRLQILDPGAALDARPTGPAAAAPTTTPAEAAPTSRSDVKVRAARDEREESPRPVAEDREKTARGLLAKAEEEFGKRRYREAGAFFDQAHQAEPKVASESKDRWAYCKLHRVVEQLNQGPTGPQALQDMEKETRVALEMAPRLEYAKQLLTEIEKRKGGAAVAGILVKHADRGADGWARAETTNFRVFHGQSREMAEQVAQIAEKTRTEMGSKWFGGLKEDWNPRCDIFLHARSADYAKATGAQGGSPGHSTIRTEGTRVLTRRIDLHCDNVPALVNAVLPHETTHIILAGQFGDQPVPRWADEGIAVLTEPREKVDQHLRNLTRCRQENTVFQVRQLMQLADYPEPRYVAAFYAQSVSLVDFLATERGPQVFVAFLREAMRTNNYEQALQRHYGYQGFADLEQRWGQKAFAADATPARVAQQP